ncbi:MAG TPA: trimethylamine methyltransferase family protein [Thermoleophilia bacterium]|nr:trimethylamine methyltransferase family protein [Thermoleophilia bacterium]
MATKTASLLSRASLDRIHRESLRILENIGVRVENAECRRALERAGAKVVGQTDVLRLPAAMVEEAMAQLTKTFELVHPGGERFTVPDGRSHAGTRVKMPKVLEYGATSYRPPRRQDVIDLCRITSALPGAEFTVAIQYPCSDVPAEIDVADTLGLVLAITGRLSLCAPSNVDDARTSLDLAMVACGSDSLDRDPATWVEINTTTPLVLGDREGDIILHVVGRHCPVDVGPMPVAGVATPATLAANLALGNAEALFLCTLANALWPGAKVLHAVTGSIMNMRTAYLSMGSAETCLLSSGEIALARYYGLPTTRMGGYSDAQLPDVQAGIEKAFAILILSQSEADFVTMGGPLDNAAHHSYEQVVIDHDIWEMAQRLTREIVVDDETLAYDVIARVGPGGSFLGETHTRRHIQAGEHYYGGSFNHSGRAGEEYTMLARAHQRVEQILAEPFSYQAPQDAVRRVMDYVRDHAAARGVAAPAWTE